MSRSIVSISRLDSQRALGGDLDIWQFGVSISQEDDSRYGEDRSAVGTRSGEGSWSEVGIVVRDRVGD